MKRWCFRSLCFFVGWLWSKMWIIVNFPALLYTRILIPKAAPQWLAVVYLVLMIAHIMSSSQPAQSAAWLVSRLSPVDRTLPCFLARHQFAAIAIPLPLSLCFSLLLYVPLQSYRVNWQDWESNLFCSRFFFFFCTQTVARERRHLQDGLEFIEMDLLQLSSLAYTSKSSFLLYPFMLSPSLRPCHPPGPQAGPVSTVEQAADSTLTSVEDGRMRSSDRREGGKERREERGTNERDSHSRGLSLHLQITAPLTLFDIYPKWPGRSIFSLYQWGGGGGVAY